MISSILLTALSLSYIANGGTRVNIDSDSMFFQPTNSSEVVYEDIGYVEENLTINRWSHSFSPTESDSFQRYNILSLRYGDNSSGTFYGIFEYNADLYWRRFTYNNVTKLACYLKVNINRLSYIYTDFWTSDEDLQTISDLVGMRIYLNAYTSQYSNNISLPCITDINLSSVVTSSFVTPILETGYQGSTTMYWGCSIQFYDIKSDTSNFYNGYQAGVDSVDTQYYYDLGFEQGKLVGQSVGNPISVLFNSIVNLPFFMVNQLFGYELYGINMYAMLSSLITLAIMLYILRKTLLK